MINQLVAGSMLVEAIVFGTIAYIAFQKKKAKLARCQRVWGEVVDVKEHSGDEGSTRHPVIRYTTSSGQTATFESKYGSSSWKVKTGDRLEIFVNPNDPSDAEVVGFMSQFLVPLALTIISVASLIGAPVVYLLMKG